MPKEKRGRYKKYLLDESKAIPKSTIYYQNQIPHPDVNILTKTNTSYIRSENENLIEYDIGLNNEPDLIEPLGLNVKNHAPLSIDETNLYALRNIEEITNETEEISDDFNADFNQELTDIISDNNLVKEDLAAAYLAAFYNGRTSQQSLSDCLQLSNIYSPVKLPTTFNGLKSLKSKKMDNLPYENSWFCCTCLKHFTKLTHRLQRACEYFKTR